MILRVFFSLRLVAVLTGFLCCTGTLFIPDVTANDEQNSRWSRHNRSSDSFSIHGKEDEGNEFTGETAAWIFAVANLTVVVSLLSKGMIRYIPLSAPTKDRIKQLNQFQKKYLISLHYFLNPLGLMLAFLHVLLSCCRSTALPEWGLIGMACLTGIGIIMKFKLLSKSLRQSIYQIHTNPIPLALLLIILLAGHNMVD